ncbi:DNA polymerase III subunit epsilon [Candidatus Pelagibacter sp.]|nr:DNA polymerase III subunit epsilon [Candidatus Pelagibacter sp.]
MKEVILDTETTGLDVKDGHRIVEIGCLEIDNYVLTSKKFHCYLNPERKVSEQALKVHGYTDSFLAKQKKFSDIVDEFSDFIKDKKLVIHNANFDLSHLNNELAILGKNKINSQNVIDTLELARSKFPGAQNSLDALCKRFKIDNSKRVKHTALVDCELLSKVYVNLTGQKEPTLDLKIGENNIELEDNKKKVQYFNMVIKPTNEEIKLHKKFLKTKLKKNFF